MTDTTDMRRESIQQNSKSRVSNSQPIKYRIMKKLNSDLMLQGLFTWFESNGLHGSDWEDIETVLEPSIRQGGDT